MPDHTRRQFLGAAAAVAGLPDGVDVDPATDRADEDDDTPTLVECDTCGAEQHPDYVDETTVATALESALVCRSCQFVQNHSLPDDVCMQCGDALDGPGYTIDLEFANGPADVPSRLAGQLCADCSGWIACDINFGGVRADDAASEQLHELSEEMTIASNALREDWPPGD